MPITLSYDLRNVEPNERSYVRSTLERFGWVRLGGSVFRYTGRPTPGGELLEDWLNDVAPSLMYVRSYVLSVGGTFRFFTIDAMSSSLLINADEEDEVVGNSPEDGDDLHLRVPTNTQSSEQRIRLFVDAAIEASTAAI